MNERSLGSLGWVTVSCLLKFLRGKTYLRHSGMRLLAQARNPYSLSWLWIPGSRFAPRNDEQLFPSRQLLCGLPEHVLSRLVVERLFLEFADRESGLHRRPRTNFGIPALDVRIIVERKPLRLVGHGPGKAGDVGNRIVAGDVSAGLAKLRIEHPIKPGRLVAIARDGVGNFLLRIEREMAVLAEHRTKPAHLPHQPLRDLGSAAHVLREKSAGLVGEINQDRARFKNRKWPSAIGRRMIYDGRNAIVRTDRQKIGLELVAGPDVHGKHGVGNADFLEHDRDFPAVRRRRIVKVDHGMILNETAAILPPAFGAFHPARTPCTPRSGHGRQDSRNHGGY